MKDGQLVQMIQRQDIEGSTPDVVASELQSAYDAHCG
jgi:putative YphP/YqiW family bacilliredoxin